MKSPRRSRSSPVARAGQRHGDARVRDRWRNLDQWRVLVLAGVSGRAGVGGPQEIAPKCHEGRALGSSPAGAQLVPGDVILLEAGDTAVSWRRSAYG
jgi:hypothetical protein